MLRCKQIVKDGMLNEYPFTEEEKEDVMNLVENKDKMREISLRMVTQTCRSLKKSMGGGREQVDEAN